MAFLSRIRSIQRGTVTIANGNTSGTATLGTTLTDTAKSELRMLGFELGDASYVEPRRNFPRIALTNTTTITANIGNTASGSFTISYEITEWY